jgi:biotin carboxylase
MRTIVFIGTQKSGSSREAIRAAEKLGYYTALLTDRESFLEKRTQFPDVHYMQLCKLTDVDEIRKAIKHLQLKALDISAIVSFVDPYCYTACNLAEELGINNFTTTAVGNMLNKVLSRKLLSDSPFVPYFDVISTSSNLQKAQVEKYLPLIMKSPNSTGSKDVFKISSYKQFKNTMTKLYEKYPDESILIEEFLDGPQHLVETVVYKGHVNIIAIFEQEITFTGRFIVTGYNMLINPPASFYNNLKTAVESIVKAHGMEHGPCHLEMRYVKNQWKLIEANPRISGGAMNKIIEIGLGINLVQETLKVSLNQEPDFRPKYKYHTFAQYVIVPEAGILQKVTGKNKAAKSPGVKHVYIKPKKGTMLVPPMSMGNRYAFVIATGETEQQARENAKQAASQINFHLLPLEAKNNDVKAEENPNAKNCKDPE